MNDVHCFCFFDWYIEPMITITEYDDDRRDAFRTLNEEWLRKYFAIEPADKEMLEDPGRTIIGGGGMIFFAESGGEIVGTAALISRGPGQFELGKMAVTERFRGHGIGSMLLEYSFAYAQKMRAQKIILYSNTVLETAIHLYRKHGFVEIPLDPGLYKRSNIKMEKILSSST